MSASVYDPDDLRLVAQFDDQHFPTIYQYNDEGQLVRIKKETYRGVKTISETQYNSAHKLNYSDLMLASGSSASFAQP